jgi:hypothetical protein
MIKLSPERQRNFCVPYQLASHTLTDEERGFLVTIYYATQILRSQEAPEGKEQLISSLVAKGFMKRVESHFELTY